MAESSSFVASQSDTSIHTSVLFEKKGRVGIITLNRPERYNAVNHDLVLGLLAALDEVKMDDTIRCVIIRGEGKGFSAGADLGGGISDINPEEMDDYITDYYGGICRRIMALPKPVIASIHGSVAGVSTAFALSCDLRIMAESSNFRFAFINIGLGTDGGAGWLLQRAVGYSRAFQIAIDGEKIPSSTCLSLGLCNKVVADDRLRADTLSWAQHLAKRPPLGVAFTKKTLHHAHTNSFSDSVAYEAKLQAKALGSEDFVEGVSAFLEKRKPEFKGK